MDEARHAGFMAQALVEAKRALDGGEFPVGCVIAGPEGVVAVGRRCNSVGVVNELDHAEIVALRDLLSSGRKEVLEPERLAVYSTMEPCLMCFSTLILNGIRTIVYAYEDVMGGGTNVPLSAMNPLYAAMKVRVIPHVLRQESLALFTTFFLRPDNRYWADSLLAIYTLAQNR